MNPINETLHGARSVTRIDRRNDDAGRSSAWWRSRRHARPGARALNIYFPAAQNWSQVSELGMSLVCSTDHRPESMTEAVRSAILRGHIPIEAIFNVRTMDRVVQDSLARSCCICG